MKKFLLTGIFVICLLMTAAGCSAANLARQLETAEDQLEDRMDAVEDTIEDALRREVAPAPAAIPEAPVAVPQETDTGNPITLEEAQRIAFDQVGLTIDQVQRLRTNFETDDGVSRYDVEFFTDAQKYEFEIDAQTGKILSFDRDDLQD